jgi:ribonucleoside-diphosphate reductase alpha chain
MQIVKDTSDEYSNWLGAHWGTFPALKDSTLSDTSRRNATLLCVAPTGTTSLIAGTSYGIEPYYALSYSKTFRETDNTVFTYNKYFEDYITKHYNDVQIEIIKQYLQLNGTLQDLSRLGGKWEDNKTFNMIEIFKCAADVTPLDHVRVQAIFQRYIDNSVSKTINLPQEAMIEDIRRAVLLAYETGCKGITVYRDGCRSEQPLKVERTSGGEEEESSREGVAVVTALKRAKELAGKTCSIETGCGKMLVTVNMDEDGQLAELLMRAGASGGCAAFTDAVARLVSVSLRYGVPVEVILDQMKSVRCDNFRYQAGKNPELKGKSCPDAAAKCIEDFLSDLKEYKEIKQELDEAGNTRLITSEEAKTASKAGTLQEVAIVNSGSESHLAEDGNFVVIEQLAIPPASTCPECGARLLRVEGCITCQSCGYSKC